MAGPEGEDSLVLIRRECPIVPPRGKPAMKLGRSDQEMDQFRDVAEGEEVITVGTETTRVSAERLEPTTEEIQEEQRVEAWMANRWQPVILHADGTWVVGALQEQTTREELPAQQRWKLGFIHGGWGVVKIGWSMGRGTDWLEGRVRSLRMWSRNRGG